MRLIAGGAEAEPGNADAHFNFGIVLRDAGSIGEAIAAFRRAVENKPDHAAAQCSLGVALYGQGRPDEAVAAYRKAIQSDRDYAEAHCNLAIALHQLGKIDEAISSYRKAIKLKPDFAAAHNGLGAALMDAGQLAAARESLQEAVRLEPGNARYRRGVGIVTRFAADDPRLAEMEALIKDAALPVPDQIELHFALGKACDELKRHAEAFHHWQQGNALKRRQLAYNETATLEELDQVRSAFPAALIQNSPKVGHPSTVPVFIIGMPRSGTTLVEQILASHPQVFGGGELHLFRNAVESNDIRGVGARYVADLQKLAPGAQRITDKLPEISSSRASFIDIAERKNHSRQARSGRYVPVLLLAIRGRAGLRLRSRRTRPLLSPLRHADGALASGAAAGPNPGCSLRRCGRRPRGSGTPDRLSLRPRLG